MSNSLNSLNAERQPPGPTIFLITHISSETSTKLLEEFLRHYQSLGVKDYLVILHRVNGFEDSPAEQLLSDYEVDPVMIVEDYSARLKANRIEKIKQIYCKSDDWVVYADVDELQIYPEDLQDLLGKCDDLGKTFIRGEFVDRLAVNGELREIKPDSSIWEQFPFAGSVTERITGGWTRKVCAAKASVLLDNSGSHRVIYGCKAKCDYEATYSDMNAWPDSIEIHHFKWDKTLWERLDRKLACTGGDRDSIDGIAFIDEYHNLSKHLKNNKRISIEGMRYIGIPQAV